MLGRGGGYQAAFFDQCLFVASVVCALTLLSSVSHSAGVTHERHCKGEKERGLTKVASREGLGGDQDRVVPLNEVLAVSTP